MAKLEDLAERVDRLVLRHQELKRTSALIERQLERADKALGQSEVEAEFRSAPTRYDLGLLNVETRHPVERKTVPPSASRG